MNKQVTLPDDKTFHQKLKKLALNSRSVKSYLETLIIEHVLNTKTK